MFMHPNPVLARSAFLFFVTRYTGNIFEQKLSKFDVLRARETYTGIRREVYLLPGAVESEGF